MNRFLIHEWDTTNSTPRSRRHADSPGAPSWPRFCFCGKGGTRRNSPPRFVSGHDFSRAANTAKGWWASAPEI